MAHKILIIEDDRDIAEMIEYNLQREGYVVLKVFDGQEALPAVTRHRPDLVILDIMLPSVDGLDICKALRRDETTIDLPIIMLTAKSQESDKVIGLELGADDYVTKPFSPRELMARVKAVLRRTKVDKSSSKTSFGPVIIDHKRHRVDVDGQEVMLTATEFKLLDFLVQKTGAVVSRDQILDAVFGYSSEVYDRTVDAHIKSLRKKLGPAKDYIETIRGFGYRFKE